MLENNLGDKLDLLGEIYLDTLSEYARLNPEEALLKLQTHIEESFKTIEHEVDQLAIEGVLDEDEYDENEEDDDLVTSFDSDFMAYGITVSTSDNPGCDVSNIVTPVAMHPDSTEEKIDIIFTHHPDSDSNTIFFVDPQSVAPLVRPEDQDIIDTTPYNKSDFDYIVDVFSSHGIVFDGPDWFGSMDKQ